MASSVSSDHNPETKEDVAALSDMNPELNEFLAKNPLPPRDYSDLPAMRAARRIQEAAALGSLGPAPSSVLETQQNISLPDGATSEILLFQPKSATFRSDSTDSPHFLPIFYSFHSKCQSAFCTATVSLRPKLRIVPV